VDCGLPLWTPSTDHLQNGIKIINKYFSDRLSNRLLVLAKFQMLHCANVTDLGSSMGAIYIITHCHFLCYSGMTIQYMKDQKASGSLKICAFSSLPFCSAHSPVCLWTRSRLHNYRYNGISLQIQTSLNDLKTHVVVFVNWRLLIYFTNTMMSASLMQGWQIVFKNLGCPKILDKLQSYFFSGYVHLAVSIFFTKLSGSLNFLLG